MFKAFLRNSAIAAATLTIGLLSAQAAQAGQFHRGWNYSIDAMTDGSGGSIFEIKGLAIKETADDVFVSISANLPLAGTTSAHGADRNIGWGDLFFDFGGGTFNEANANSSLFAINFAAGSDSGAAQTGVYSGVSAKSVTLQNSGYSTLQQYYAAGYGRENSFGTDFSSAEDVYGYYAGNTTGANTQIRNVIDSGTRLGSISYLDGAAAAAQGLDFANFDAIGNEQITFRFDRTLLPSNAYIAHLLLECGNDGVAISGALAQDVPEPGAMLGLVTLGLLATRLRRKQTA